MKVEISYGVIPLKNESGVWKVLLIQHNAGHWGYPKGHGQKGETPLQTAKRELYEETSLVVQSLLHETPLTESYTYSIQGNFHNKKVSYFLAKVLGEVKIQADEIKDSKWLPLTKAEEALTFKELKNLTCQVLQVMKLGKSGKA